VHDLMSGYVARGIVPGAVVLVAHRGETYVDVIGAVAPGSAMPLRRESIFRISSMTKPITAAAVMVLVDEGRLHLDDPVDRFLPELADRRVLRRLDGPLDDTVPASRPIAVRDLLTFTMGLGLIFGPPDAYPIVGAMDALRLGQGLPSPATPPAPDEWIRRLGTLPLVHQPGERWMYNTGADVAGVLVARASGQPFEAFLRERIFEPLGMPDTAFRVPQENQDRFVPSYLTDPQTGALSLYDDPSTGQWSRTPAFPSGAAGLVSTADDYAAFAEMLLHQGEGRGKRILSAESMRLMTRDQLTAAQKAASAFTGGFFEHHSWGLGMAVKTGDDGTPRATGTFGWDGGMGTGYSSDPRNDLTTILMTQAAWVSPDPPAHFRDFAGAVYEAFGPGVSPPVKASSRER
jgi:CubicO group peptidase (beta-lactamase class C family)